MPFVKISGNDYLGKGHKFYGQYKIQKLKGNTIKVN